MKRRRRATTKLTISLDIELSRKIDSLRRDGETRSEVVEMLLRRGLQSLSTNEDIVKELKKLRKLVERSGLRSVASFLVLMKLISLSSEIDDEKLKSMSNKALRTAREILFLRSENVVSEGGET